jgi:hypothetical protein
METCGSVVKALLSGGDAGHLPIHEAVAESQKWQRFY